MRLPNQFPHDAAMKPVIVTDNGWPGAGSGQGRQQQDSTARLNDPIRGPNFSTQMAQNNIILGAPTQAELETFTAPAENGTMGMAFGTTGDPNMTLAFIAKGMNNSGAAPGNLNPLSFFGPLAQTIMDLLGKLVSKGYQTKNRDGAEVREPLDGQEWMHSLTNGLPVHAALFNLSGTKIPNVKNIDTAVQQSGFGAAAGMISGLMGQIMSMASMLSSLQNNKKQKQQITQNMPPETAAAFDSMVNLTQSPDGSYIDVTHVRCNSEIYIKNCANLFSQCTTVDDLVHCFRRVQYDSSLRGLETLPKTKIKSNTAFGTIDLVVDGFGNVDLDDYGSKANSANVYSVNDYFTGNTSMNASTGSANTGGQQQNQNNNMAALQMIQQIVNMAMSAANPGAGGSAINHWKEKAGKVVESAGRTKQGKELVAQIQQIQAVNARLTVLAQFPWASSLIPTWLV